MKENIRHLAGVLVCTRNLVVMMNGMKENICHLAGVLVCTRNLVVMMNVEASNR